MKSRKFSTIFLSLLLVFTLLVAAGCEKENPTDEPKKTDVVDNKDGKDGKDTTDPKKETDTKTDTKTNNNGSTTNTVKLLKRNGVEWKENTRINSKRGAKSYKVVWGDTLSLIARTWHVNCYKLADYNGIKNIDLIEVDQIIYNYAAK